MTRDNSDVNNRRDAKLVARFQAGDADAFTAIFSNYSDRLQRHARGRLHDNDDAQDAVQEAFTKALAALPRSCVTRLYAWLWVIVNNECTARLRASARYSRTCAERDTYSSTDPTTAMAVRDTWAGLSARNRSTLAMRHIDGLSYAEIGLRADLSPSAVEAQIWRARQQFRVAYTLNTKEV